MSSLRDRLESVRERAAQAANRSGRLPSAVEVVAVSKTVAPEIIVEAYHLGQRDFAENRVQEFRDKRDVLDRLGGTPGARWHLVGRLQSNKSKPATRLFDIIQSVDSVKLARLLDSQAELLGKRQPVLLEVDYTPEAQRAGFAPEELERVAPDLVALPNLRIQGLMTVAPLGMEGEGLRAVFRSLRLLRDRLAVRYTAVEWHHLSMGMSDDFELAIEEGSSIVRIGRAIFGERPQP